MFVNCEAKFSPHSLFYFKNFSAVCRVANPHYHLSKTVANRECLKRGPSFCKHRTSASKSRRRTRRQCWTSSTGTMLQPRTATRQSTWQPWPKRPQVRNIDKISHRNVESWSKSDWKLLEFLHFNSPGYIFGRLLFFLPASRFRSARVYFFLLPSSKLYQPLLFDNFLVTGLSI